MSFSIGIEALHRRGAPTHDGPSVAEWTTRDGASRKEAMPETLRQNTADYDVAVIGGGPGGFPAAVAAARGGARTVLVERTAALGGAAASGLGILGFLDRAGNKALGGIAQELIDRLAVLGGSPGHFRCPVHNSITPVSADLVKIVTAQMCEEAGVDILFDQELIGAEADGGNLTSVTVYGKLTLTEISADVFIDATGDGDLAYLAGVPHTRGQDGTTTMQPSTLMFTVTGHDLPRLFDYLEAHPGEMGIKEDYAAGYDVEFLRRTPGHCFIGLTDSIAEARAAGKFTVPRNQFIYITTASDRLLAINTSRVIRIDASDPRELSKGVELGYRQVLEIVDFLRDNIPGFEEVEIAQIAPALGVRETRHFEGRTRLTLDDLYSESTKSEAVALSGYNIDVHSGNSDGIDLELVEEAFGIPYGCLIPKNVHGLLLSGRTISMDSSAFASARAMGPCMAIAEAAGTAAAMARAGHIDPRELEVQDLRDRLRAQGAILPAPEVHAAQRDGGEVNGHPAECTRSGPDSVDRVPAMNEGGAFA